MHRSDVPRGKVLPPIKGTPESIAIENVCPELDCGRFPVKRNVGDTFEVAADIFKDGRNEIKASLKHRRRGSKEWNETPMLSVDNDRWMGRFVLDEIGVHEYTIEAWTDTFVTSLHALQKWTEAGEDVSTDVRGLHKIIEATIQNATEPDRSELSALFEKMGGADHERVTALAGQPRFLDLMSKYSVKGDASAHRILQVVVDRNMARFAAWYEMFHRSQGAIQGKSATFRDCGRRLADVQQMGFDVVYLPPIHPIGRTNRRGKNNSPDQKKGDPGSPWAIGSEEGGHTSINPDLGTMEDFEQFLESARKMNIEVAIDLAFQCSPDHPYVKTHPDWFFHRSDGTIRYAENPPKKYLDIYPLNFAGEQWKDLWREARRVVLFWVEKGVKTFRVDNPHTKPLGFWEWLILQVKEKHPEVIFLAEAFTRPKLMKRLAKLGFDQSYTYFTWKNTKRELTEFLSEFVTPDAGEYYRGNFFTNTPDILTEYLQKGGRPAFRTRLVLAATLSSLYGIYNGYEICEGRALAPGSEEYLDSEKYQHKVWDWERPGNIKSYITKLNSIRRTNPALQFTRNLRLLRASNDSVIFYGKWTQDKSNIILVAANLDPFHIQESTVFVPINELGIEPTQAYSVHDLITDREYRWKGESNYVKLDPEDEPAHVFLLQK